MTTQTLLLSSVLSSSQERINAVLNDQQKSADKFAQNSRTNTYKVAAEIVLLGRQLLQPENEAAFAGLLVSKGIDLTENPWAAIVNLAVPGRDGKGDKTWKNRSGALRALDRWSKKGADADTLACFIDQFDLHKLAVREQKLGDRNGIYKAVGETGGGRLDGLAKLDRLMNRDPSAPTDKALLGYALGAEAMDLSAVQVEDDRTVLVMVWARVEKGKVIPMRVVPNSQNEARKAALQTGRIISERPSKEAVHAVVDAKKGDFVFGDELVTTTEPAVVRPEPEIVKTEAQD